MTRRELIRHGAIGLAGVAVPRLVPLGLEPRARALKIAVITDLHHGLAPDAESRLAAFVEEVHRRKDIDLVLQMGDFCHAIPESNGFLGRWNEIKHPKLHVLGNHDMDRVDKEAAMKFWGMKSRYGAYEHGGFRLIVLDLNHLKKDGKLVPYANGNYFTDNATFNLADPEQLAWLAGELRRGSKPTILISHQPLGFGNPGEPLPPEQIEVFKVVQDAARENPKGAVVVCLSGHLHVDRLEVVEGLPCLCVNSASYFWSAGMYAYSKPLYAFLEFTKDGHLAIEGVAGEFLKPPPADSSKVVGRSASIVDRRIATR